jgi:hypothetical protein
LEVDAVRFDSVRRIALALPRGNKATINIV